MIDFSTVEVICESDSINKSFVGLFIDENNNNKKTLKLPAGCDAWCKWIKIEEDPIARHQRCLEAFILIYKVIQIFVDTRDIEASANNSKSAEGNSTSDNGSETDEEKIEFFNQLDVLTPILHSFDPLAITGLKQRWVLADRFDAKLVTKQLDKALIGNDGVPFWSELEQAKDVLTVHPFELVQMYCWALRDVQTQILGNSDGLDIEVKHLAQQFAECHLPNPDASLFDPNTYALTRATLVDRLELIRQTTPVQDDDFHKLSEAMQKFLFGAEGKSQDKFGLNNFWQVWESMVLSHYIDKGPLQVAALNKDNVPQKQRSAIDPIKDVNEKNGLATVDKLKSTFSLNVGSNIKQLQPDLVLDQKYGIFNNKDWLDLHQQFVEHDLAKINSAEVMVDYLKMLFASGYLDIYNKTKEDIDECRKDLGDDAFNILKVLKEHSNNLRNKYDVIFKDKDNDYFYINCSVKAFNHAVKFKFSPINIFLLGRCYAGSIQSFDKFEYKREKIFMKLAKIGDDKPLNVKFFFCLGAIWEAYFNSSNILRDSMLDKKENEFGWYKDFEETWNRRVELYGFVFIRKQINDDENKKNPIAQSLNKWIEALDSIVEFRDKKTLCDDIDPSQLSQLYKIIDAKYHSAEYFENAVNLDEFKNKSDRKQYVYEYCIEKSLKSKVPFDLRSEYASPGMCSNLSQCNCNNVLDKMHNVNITMHPVQPYCVRCLMLNYAKNYVSPLQVS